MLVIDVEVAADTAVEMLVLMKKEMSEPLTKLISTVDRINKQPFLETCSLSKPTFAY